MSQDYKCTWFSPTLCAELLSEYFDHIIIVMHIFQLQAVYTWIIIGFNLSGISGEVFLCNEGRCGLRKSTRYIKVCINIRQLLFLRQNGPKKKFN